MPDPVAVRSMFARIAGRYDLLNRCLSAGIDQRWRRRTVAHTGRLLGRSLVGTRIVDACCGTGDLSVLYRAAGAAVVGVDFTHEMLERAVPKGSSRELIFVHGDALRLPLADRSADACAVAFGLRNLADRGAGLREMVRVVRPGGALLVLEFTQPEGRLFGAAYRAYFTKVLPRLGALVSRDAEAYRYLPDTVLAWPDAERLRHECDEAGWADTGYETLTQGIAALHYGRVPHGDRVPEGRTP